MRKTLTIENAKNSFFYTNILDNIAEAKCLTQEVSKKEGDTKIQVLMVKDKDQEILYALKSISCPASDIDTITQAKNEFYIAKKLGDMHPNIAKGMLLKELSDPTKDLHVVEVLMEYGGDNLLAWSKAGELTGDRIITIAIQTASAMECAHKEGVFHSNLKPQNIAYKEDTAKVIDFGISSIQRITGSITNSMLGITVCYAPPEFLQRDLAKQMYEKLKLADSLHISSELEKAMSERICGFSREKVDVYMWAMIFYQLVSKKSSKELDEEWEEYRQAPEMYSKFKDQLNELKMDDFKYGQTFIKLLSACLSYSPVDRPTFEQINKDWLCDFNECVIKEKKPVGSNDIIKSKRCFLSDIDEDKEEIKEVAKIVANVGVKVKLSAGLHKEKELASEAVVLSKEMLQNKWYRNVKKNMSGKFDLCMVCF
eukprot:TRINITY_DN969_c1_g1_i6.p1 TRINITY_DN969_c1_g1~~TRINITY_DN969_c1_g1_i6.p1  ORF type:complete len:426 (-),score=47.96 TRINITY_DN969_c1_g1_i6:393-1670(-)